MRTILAIVAQSFQHIGGIAFHSDGLSELLDDFPAQGDEFLALENGSGGNCSKNTAR